MAASGAGKARNSTAPRVRVVGACRQRKSLKQRQANQAAWQGGCREQQLRQGHAARDESHHAKRGKAGETKVIMGGYEAVYTCGCCLGALRPPPRNAAVAAAAAVRCMFSRSMAPWRPCSICGAAAAAGVMCWGSGGKNSNGNSSCWAGLAAGLHNREALCQYTAAEQLLRARLRGCGQPAQQRPLTDYLTTLLRRCFSASRSGPRLGPLYCSRSAGLVARMDGSCRLPEKLREAGRAGTRSAGSGG